MHQRLLNLTLIRHAPTIYPKGTLPPRDPDVDLSDDDAIAFTAGHIPKDAEWWVSPLSRCQKTSDALIAHGPSPAHTITDDALAEQDYGDWHGMAIADIWNAVKDGPKSNWHFLHPSVTPPNGESFDDLTHRMRALLSRIEKHQANNLVLIAHGMVIRSLIGLCQNINTGQALAYDIAPLSVSRLTFMADGLSASQNAGGAWMVNTINSVKPR